MQEDGELQSETTTVSNFILVKSNLNVIVHVFAAPRFMWELDDNTWDKYLERPEVFHQ